MAYEYKSLSMSVHGWRHEFASAVLHVSVRFKRIDRLETIFFHILNSSVRSE